MIIPLDLALNILDLLQLVAKFDDGEIDHARIESERATDRRLNGPRSIEAHDEVVALRVAGLVARRWLGQAEGAPVRVAADYAAGADDLGAGIAGNSVCLIVSS